MILPCVQEDSGRSTSGVSEHVEEPFLNDSKQIDFHFTADLRQVRRNPEVHGYACTLTESFDIPSQRRDQAGTFELGGMAEIGERPHFLQAPLAKIAAFTQQLQAGFRYSAPHSFQVFEIDGDCEEMLSRRVVEFSGNSPPFVILQCEELRRELLQFDLGTFQV